MNQPDSENVQISNTKALPCEHAASRFCCAGASKIQNIRAARRLSQLKCELLTNFSSSLTYLIDKKSSRRYLPRTVEFKLTYIYVKIFLHHQLASYRPRKSVLDSNFCRLFGLTSGVLELLRKSST